MKFTCTQENLVRGVSNTAPIAGKNSQLPILQYILLRVEKNTLILTTTDLEVGVRAVIGGKMDAEGSCALPAKRFLEYVQQLPSGNPITLERKGDVIHISTKGFRAQFTSSDPEEYPLLPEAGAGQDIVVSGDEFTGGIGRVLFSAAREETRPEIRSVFLAWKSGALRVAATDSFRLAEYVMDSAFQGDVSAILPLSSAQEVIRLFSGQDQVRVAIHDNYISFVADGIELTSRLVDGEYPRYEDIIPTTHASEIYVERAEFSRALKTVSVFLPKESRRVSLEVKITELELTAKVAGGDLGEGDVVLGISGEGENVGVLVNIQYIIDGISHITSPKCTVLLSGQYDPIVFRQQEKGSVYTYVVMPIQA
ncbi:MAG: DNA polymerase III subunit beta [Candidatus Andersenbacteria bacterium]